MKWRGEAFRAHDPRWAWSPTSGEGASLKGGRFNPIGTPALYLALSLEGVFVEMSYGFGHRFDPLTVCAYDVDIDGIVDLTTEEGRSASNTTLSELGCAWKDDLIAGRIPASWRVAQQLIAKGAIGVIVPSFAVGARPDMRNLVLWSWGDAPPRKVTVHDPTGRLPKDQSSWT